MMDCLLLLRAHAPAADGLGRRVVGGRRVDVGKPRDVQGRARVSLALHGRDRRRVPELYDHVCAAHPLCARPRGRSGSPSLPSLDDRSFSLALVYLVRLVRTDKRHSFWRLSAAGPGASFLGLHAWKKARTASGA